MALNRSLAIAEERGDALNQCGCWARCICSISAAEISKPPCITQGAAEPLPRPSRIRPLLRWPTPFWGFRSILWATLAAPAWSLRPRYSIGRAPSGRTTLSRLRSPLSGRHRPGADAVAARPSGSGRGTRTPEPSRTPQAWTIRYRCRRPGLGCVGLPLDRRSRERRRAHRLVHLPCRIQFPGALLLRSDGARKAELAIRRGDVKGGVESLQGVSGELHAVRYELLTTEFNISLVQGLAAIGRFAEGIALIDETIRQVEANGDLSYMPELLRVKGGLLLSMPQPSVDDAEMCFMQSLELSRRQGARAWELRTAIDLAALLADQGRSDERSRAFAAGIRAIRRGLGYGGSESCRTSVGDLGLISIRNGGTDGSPGTAPHANADRRSGRYCACREPKSAQERLRLGCPVLSDSLASRNGCLFRLTH